MQRDHRKFSLSGEYQNEVQTSEIISRSRGATDCYFCRYPQKRPISVAVLFRRRAGRRLCGLQSKKRISARRIFVLKPRRDSRLIAKIEYIEYGKIFLYKVRLKTGSFCGAAHLYLYLSLVMAAGAVGEAASRKASVTVAEVLLNRGPICPRRL